MTKQIEYREDCFETIRECIKGKMSLKATIDECIKTYPDIHPQTVSYTHLTLPTK